MEKTNEILTIAGKRVKVRYSTDSKDCCRRCPFSDDEVCTALDEQYVIPCRKHDKDGKYAYFVPAGEIEGTPQEVTLIPSNEDADKAATDYYLNLPNSSYGEGGNLLPRSINEAFKAGIAYERERMASCPTIKGWIARDEDGALSFFGSKPYRNFGNWVAEVCIKLNRELFPRLKMKNGPMKVKLIILK